jgi:hypothetical protein
MKPRHAAALALVGWYLMMPPQDLRVPGDEIEETAPLSRWIMAGSYDSADECAAVQSKLLSGMSPSETAKVKADLKKHGKEWSGELYKKRVYASQCISTDDPRLKDR